MKTLNIPHKVHGSPDVLIKKSEFFFLEFLDFFFFSKIFIFNLKSDKKKFCYTCKRSIHLNDRPSLVPI